MSKFKKLSKINLDIELLEKSGKIKEAEVLHKKFIKESQYAMPQMMPMMMPQMMMPQMMPQMMPMMMARPTAPVTPFAASRPTTPAVPAGPQVSTNQAGKAGQAGQAGQGAPPSSSIVPSPKPSPVQPPGSGGQSNPPYEGSFTNPGGQNVPPTPPTAYGDPNQKNQELQYLQNELKRLQDQYGVDCGPFAAQCNTLRQMIDRNKGGAIIKG